MDDWRPDDLLSRVHEVCQLLWRKRGQPDVQIEELESAGFAYLRISYAHGPWTRHELLGVHDGEPDQAVLRRFRSLAGDGEVELVFRGAVPDASTGSFAQDSKIWLRAFDDYQRNLWDPRSYLRKQNNGLSGDPEYPLALHVDKRWAPLGEPTPAGQTALPAIMDWLATDGPRFVLVLGDFGTGKTFLLRTIANELADREDLVPVLITMRDLEKGRTLDELLAQHMARCGEDPFHGSAFRYLLREGRIVLLFDGFDELALRTSYERVPQHFATLREAAAGAAKVVVTSRHQYFATDQAVRNALGDEVHRMRGSRIIRLFPLESDQRRELVLKTFDDDRAADEFIDALRDVPNLLDLATNPRMLSFMIRWYREGILTKAALARSAGQRMTAGALYQLLLTTWLEHEVARQVALGGLIPLSVAQRMDALRETAMRMWRTGRRGLGLEDLGEVANRISDLARLEMRPGEAAHAVGSSTVLVRTKDDEFTFIHQSVMEWFVAATARDALADGTVDALLANSEMTGPMVDFWCDLADSHAVIAWAQDITSREKTPGAAAKANASLILQRRGAQATTVNYSGQDLRGRDLSGQDFGGANLSEANLSGAVLPKNMRQANLYRARLVGARLVGTDLTEANLSHADLRQARLIGANLTDANLSEARLDRAVMLGATLDPAQLEGASTVGAALPSAQLEPQIVGHSPITALAVWPDNLLMSGHTDGTVRIHDVAATRTLRILRAHTGPVTALAAVPGSEWLASGGSDGAVRIWDTTSGVIVHELTGHQRGITALAIAPQGDWLACSDRQSIYIWRPDTGDLVRKFEANGNVQSMAVHPSGDWLITAGSSLRVWGITIRAPVRDLAGNGVRDIVISANGTSIMGHDEQGVMSWDFATGQSKRVESGEFTAFATGSQNTLLAVSGSKRMIYVHDWFSRRRAQTVVSTHTIQALAMDQSGQWLAAADARGVLQVWHPGTGQLIAAIGTGRRALTSMAVRSGPASRLATTSTDNGDLWDLTKGCRATTVPGSQTVVAANPISEEFVFGWPNGHLSFLETETMRSRTQELGIGAITSIAMDDSGRWLAAGGEDHQAAQLLILDRQSRNSFTGHEIRSLAFDPQGRWLASSGGDKYVLLWDTGAGWWRRSGLKSTLFSAHDVMALAVVPHRRWLITAGQEDVLAWDVENCSRQALFEFTGNPARAVVAGPDGRWLAAGDTAGFVRAWYVDSQKVRYTIRAHTGAVNALSVDPQGKWFASAGDDGAVRLWDRATGNLLATLVASIEGWIVILPDGRYKFGGNPAGLWWAAGLCRFDLSDLADLKPYLPNMRRIAEEEPLELSG